jgi:hypothetical protein
MEKYPDLGMTWADMQMVGSDGEIVNLAYLRHMDTAYRRFTNDELFSRSVPLREIAPDLASTVGDARFRGETGESS